MDLVEPFLNINEKDKIINFEKGAYELKRSIILPKGYTVVIESGFHLDLKNASSIISYSPIRALGNYPGAIRIFSSDSTGQGIVVMNADNLSLFRNVNFSTLSNISTIDYQLTAALTFYESKVSFRNCSFYGNVQGDDYLNAVRTDILIDSCSFRMVYADAFDGDFCRGTITNTSFTNIGNDAIDVSGSSVSINKVTITQALDKGISGGEKSDIYVTESSIYETAIAVASKDNSDVKLLNSELFNNTVDFTAFQKKSEYGPASISAVDVDLRNSKMMNLIEVNSTLSFNGTIINGDNVGVSDILYGKIYGKASR